MSDPAAPEGLGPRGRSMWAQMTENRKSDAAWLMLLHEACRMLDRMDKMDRLLSGDIESWARIELPDLDGKPCILIFDDALAESRQYANTFRQILVTLKVGMSEAGAEKKEGDPLDEFTRLRAERKEQREALRRHTRAANSVDSPVSDQLG